MGKNSFLIRMHSIMTSADSSTPPSNFCESPDLVQKDANSKSGWLESTFGRKSLRVSVRCTLLERVDIATTP